MLTSIEFTNFKTWSSTGKVRLAPITVFFGTNSSGKSSIQQFILMLKQTAESPDRRRVLHPGIQGTTPVVLGSFADFVHNHDTDSSISFSLSWDVPEKLTLIDKRNERDYPVADLEFEASVGQSGDQSQLQVQTMSYQSKGPNGSAGVTVGMTPIGTRRGQYDITADGYELVRNRGRQWKLPPPVRFYGFPPETIAYHQNADFVTDLVLSLEQELRRVTYLGPLRQAPARNYTWSGDAPEHVGWAGERTIDAVLAASGRRLNQPHKKGERFQEVIARWLKAMGLIDHFQIEPVARGSDLFEARVRAPGSSETVLLPDVGFGVSQVLPVIVECFYAQPNSTIIMEQPEIHLHPAVQSNLADMFVETIAARENGEDRNVQLIVESHSEHFLRRLQRRVAEGKVEPDDVALYFAERGRKGAALRPLDVDLLGNIRNWPPNFFGDPMEDVAAQAKAGIRRRRESTS